MKLIGKQIISITVLCTMAVTSAQAYSLNNYRLMDDRRGLEKAYNGRKGRMVK